MKTRLLRLALSLLLVIVSFPAAAQSDLSADELALIAEIQTALDHFTEYTSYRMTGTQSIVQTISANVDGTKMIIDQTFDQAISGMVDTAAADSAAAEIEIEQVITSTVPDQAAIEITQILGLIIVDDTLYMRLTAIAPPELVNAYPQGWFNISENPSAIPGADLINADQYMSLFTSGLGYSLTPESVTTITELTEEESDGQTLRGFEITLDLDVLFASGEMDQLLGAFDMSQFGMDMDKLMEEMSEKANITIALWLTPDGVIYRQDSVMTFASVLTDFIPGISEAAIDQTVTTSYSYSDFNADFAIMPPPGEA